MTSESKHRLELLSKTDKAEHQQVKAKLESKLNEEKLKYQKASDDAALKFNSLQQHYKLLQVKNQKLQYIS